MFLIRALDIRSFGIRTMQLGTNHCILTAVVDVRTMVLGTNAVEKKIY